MGINVIITQLFHFFARTYGEYDIITHLVYHLICTVHLNQVITEFFELSDLSPHQKFIIVNTQRFNFSLGGRHTTRRAQFEIVISYLGTLQK